MPPTAQHAAYRGRLAPSPTGHLHLGHARTFWTAQERARANNGTLVLRNEDMDARRFKLEFVDAMIEDLKWFGFEWQEGPDCGGPFGPYNQSERMPFYIAALENLRAANLVYPCTCSRKDIQAAARAPHAEDDDEPIYPGTCREQRLSDVGNRKFSWRFRVPGGGIEAHSRTGPASSLSSPEGGKGRGEEVLVSVTQIPSPQPSPRLGGEREAGAVSRCAPEIVSFVDGHFGPQQFVAGKDFGDFIVWRHDEIPSYQLAVVVDDAAMEITEVVRGADLLKSTARQILLYRALGHELPGFYHCPLMTDETGVRLAKRHEALSLRALRAQGMDPAALRARWH